MIGDGKKYHYPTVIIYVDCFKEIHQIIEEIVIVETALKHTPQKINLKNTKKYVIITIEMPYWGNKILKHNPGKKSLKMPFTIYLDLECMLNKITIYSKQSRKTLYRKKAKH